MHRACFRFYGALNDFLHPRDSQRSFDYAFRGRPAIKDAIEAIGVPHPEVDLILVGGQSAGFDHPLIEGSRISVYPHFYTLDVGEISQVRPAPVIGLRFVLDTHLGRLARYLRMLGFDSNYRNQCGDDELARLSVRSASC